MTGRLPRGHANNLNGRLCDDRNELVQSAIKAIKGAGDSFGAHLPSDPEDYQ